MNERGRSYRSARYALIALPVFTFPLLCAPANAVTIDVPRAASIEGVTQYQMAIFRHDEGEVTRIGDGFFRFDQQAVDQELNEWLADPVGITISIEFPVLAAEFEIFGHTFHGDEIRWVEDFDDEGVSLNTFVTMSNGAFLNFAAGFDQGQFLQYDVNGNVADCIEGFCAGHDAGGDFFESLLQHFEWFAEPVTAPEPDTALLLGLGLLGLGLMRRNTKLSLKRTPQRSRPRAGLVGAHSNPMPGVDDEVVCELIAAGIVLC